MAEPLRRKTPEECLRAAGAEERAASRTGHLKIFLGYASGVGKTLRMLGEARRRWQRGQDVIIGAVQPRLSREAALLLQGMEILPPLAGAGGGQAIDVDAILRRQPAVCVIDGLAYNNPPGLRHAARWQDVGELLRAGIKVIASINLQYVAELRDQVQAITGKEVGETVPVAFLKSADEIEIVDAPAEASQESTPQAQAEAGRRQERLLRLRELALVLAAEVVDAQLSQYLSRYGMQLPAGAQERILLCLTPTARLDEMLAAARLVTERFHAELLAATVERPGQAPAERRALELRMQQARDAGAQVERLNGEDSAAALLRYARERGVTQIFVPHTPPRGWARLRARPLDRLIWEAHGMDVRVFPQ